MVEFKYKLVNTLTGEIVTYSDDNTKEFIGPWGDAVFEWQDNIIDLSEYKLAKWEETKNYRAFLDKSPVPYNGKLYDYDDDSRSKLDKASDALNSAYALGVPLSSIEWTCFDNTTAMLTRDDFNNLNLVIATRSGAIHSQARLIYSYIYSLTSKIEIDALDIVALFTADLSRYSKTAEE